MEPKEKLIRSIESKNNLAINIFYYENDKVNILYTSNKEEEYNNNINLLILKKEKKTHYCWIKGFARLMTPGTNNKLEYRFRC